MREFIQSIRRDVEQYVTEKEASEAAKGAAAPEGAEVDVLRAENVLLKNQLIEKENQLREAQSQQLRLQDTLRQANVEIAKLRNEASSSRGPGAKSNEWPAENLEGKTAQWADAWAQITKEWTSLSSLENLPKNDSNTSIYKRFEAAMSLLHRQMLDGELNQGNVVRLRAQFEYLMPRIWTKPEQIQSYFDDERYGAKAPRPFKIKTMADLTELDRLILVPRPYRSEEKLVGKKAQIQNIFVCLSKALNSTQTASILDANKDLNVHIDTIFKYIGASWNAVRPITTS